MIPDPEEEWWWGCRVGFWAFQAKGVESVDCPLFQEESTDGIEVPQHHQALLWRAVLLLEESLCASMHKQALGQQLAVGDEVGDRITYNRKVTLKTKGRGSAGVKCPISTSLTV